MKPGQVPGSLPLSSLVSSSLRGLSPIQTIMKAAEDETLIALGVEPSNVISFGGGWCNHEAPEALRQAYLDIAGNKDTFHRSGRYSAIQGSLAYREHLCLLDQEIYGVRDLDATNILLGHSSTQLFHDVLRVLCDPGHRVAFLDPTYANYFNGVRCALPGSSWTLIPALDPSTWEYLPDPDATVEAVQNLCSDTAFRALVLAVPDNPTSQIPSDAFLNATLEVLEDHHRYLVLDFAYKALWFGRMPACYSWSPQDHPALVTIHSNSKWLSSLGRRCGWVQADDRIVACLEKISESILLSPDTLHAMATTRYLQEALADGSCRRYIEETRSCYERTAALLLTHLDRLLGWPRLSPAGGLYTCCPVPEGMQPASFAEQLLRKEGILVIPGAGFGPSLHNGMRLSYGPLCRNHEKIKEGIERIARFCGQSGQR